MGRHSKPTFFKPTEEISVIKRIVSPEFRRWLYRVGVSVCLILAGYGFIEQEILPLWVGLLGALTNTTALAHTPIESAVNGG